MTSLQQLKPYLPSLWFEMLCALPIAIQERLQEVRLRVGEPLTVSLPEGICYLGTSGMTELRDRHGIYCSPQQVEQVFHSFCRQSVYAHRWELEQGYIAVSGGIRVGVAGTAVMRDDVSTVQQVTSLCIRLPRRIAGCATAVLDAVWSVDHPISALLVGPPACGKTTLLRDLATQLAARRLAVTVVDERGELSLGDSLRGCDVLRGYPKAVGLRQAVRCLSPQVVLFDELGDGAELEAVADCAHAGVAVIASLHGYDPDQMSRQPFVQRLVDRHVFSRWIFLQGRCAPGIIRHCYIPEVTPYGVDWCPIDGSGRDGDGIVRIPSSASSCAVFEDVRSVVTDAAAGDELYAAAAVGAMATDGAE